jgi:hypothetical protein
MGAVSEKREGVLDLVSHLELHHDPRIRSEFGADHADLATGILSHQVVTQISAHVGERYLGADDLLFTVPADPPLRLVITTDPETLGLTEPNGAGRRYRHGTLTGYSLGRCHSEHCRAADAHYRSAHRLEGKDDPRLGRPLDTDGHIPRGWFRVRMWKQALPGAARPGCEVGRGDVQL